MGRRELYRRTSIEDQVEPCDHSGTGVSEQDLLLVDMAGAAVENRHVVGGQVGVKEMQLLQPCSATSSSSSSASLPRPYNPRTRLEATDRKRKKSQACRGLRSFKAL